MFQKLVTIMGLIFILNSSASYAGMSVLGGVGSGGGGTSPADPSSMDDIAAAIQQDARIMISAWLYRQEEIFHGQTPQEQVSNPLNKMFINEKNMHQLMTLIKVEIRKQGPCFDSANNPVDGSIYGRLSGSICMSAFAMAPKLTKYNYAAETFALLVHEYSHLLGTSEDEAVAIQRVALRAFYAKDPADLRDEAQRFHDDLDYLLPDITNWAKDPTPVKNNRALLSLIDERFGKMNMDMTADRARYLLLPAGDESLYKVESLRLMLLKMYSCTQDQAARPDIRASCGKDLTAAFDGEASANFDDISTNMKTFPLGMMEEVADTQWMTNLTSWDAVAAAFAGMAANFEKIRMNLTNLQNAKLSTY